MNPPGARRLRTIPHVLRWESDDHVVIVHSHQGDAHELEAGTSVDERHHVIPAKEPGQVLELRATFPSR
jgi:hypothetical protein